MHDLKLCFLNFNKKCLTLRSLFLKLGRQKHVSYKGLIHIASRGPAGRNSAFPLYLMQTWTFNLLWINFSSSNILITITHLIFFPQRLLRYCGEWQDAEINKSSSLSSGGLQSYEMTDVCMHSSGQWSGLDSIHCLLPPSWQNSIFIQVPTPPLHKLCDLGDADS